MGSKENSSLLKKQVEECLWRDFGVALSEADKMQIYFSLSRVTADVLRERYYNFKANAKKQSAKKVCYLSMEFLLGRSLKNNLYNLDIYSEACELIKDCSYSPEQIFECENDAGLGNGGLGRLAACYLDGLATLSYCAQGYSILYERGFFKQYFHDGKQMELPDSWLDSGNVWLSPDIEKKIIVKIGGKIKKDDNESNYEGYTEIIAQGYNMYIPGYKSDGVALLKLWKAIASDKNDMSLLNEGKFKEIIKKRGEAELVSMFLYPPDNTNEGKRLRLLQQYFFVSASVQNVLSEHYKTYKTVENLAQKVSFHINDTHPVLCIPELIRVLTEDYSMEFEKAVKTVKECVFYTNHTVMPEALEKWDEEVLLCLVPRIYEILKKLNNTMSEDFYSMNASSWDKISDMSIISCGKVNMANLALHFSSKVNGVSALHTKILCNRLFSGFYNKTPDKFLNVTNAITYRRWLCQVNPSLTSLIDTLIGEEYKQRPYELINFARFSSDKEVVSKFELIRHENKKELSNISKKLLGEALDPDSMFDVQVKRLHEYKRQLLNVLKIMTYYIELTNNPSADISPKTFIFAAKAAPSYAHAKRIIMLINKLSELIKRNSRVKDVLQIAFLPNYSISLAEKIIPAADISEQISLAGKEASGTGNMKFMINGALTLGTYDGANIEICELAGIENEYIFGMRDHEVEEIRKHERNIDEIIASDDRLKEVFELLRSSICGESFSDIADYLTKGDNPDPYFCLSDYNSYMQCYRQVCIDYKNKRKYFSKAIQNVANAGYFASDRAVVEYADKIWSIDKIKN